MNGRSAWLAGATGLVGRALLGRLLADARYARVDVFTRRLFPVAPEHAARLSVRKVDFAALPADLADADDAYIALGTTIAVAGSEAAFRAVDFDAVLNVAKAARGAGATRLAVVSALGADSRSRIFYNRVKGDIETAVADLGFSVVVIARPSLLQGDRAAIGQAKRPGEVWATRLLGPVSAIVPASFRPIAADTVAAALVAQVISGEPGLHVLSSADMQRSSRLAAPR